MGLDMYLSATRYLSEHVDEDKGVVEKITGVITGLPGRLQNLIVSIGYWRKANAIHKWFVDNCQDGVDECQEAYVSKEKLQDLLDVCLQVQADPSKAAELLPTEGGFFFGGTDYDEWYIRDIQQTIEIIEKALASLDDHWSISYRSSW